MNARRLQARWREGWWTGARPCASPHCGPRPPGELPSLVIVHSISLPPGVLRGDAVEHLFLGTLDAGRHASFADLRGLRVSAHFFVRRSGEVLQFVSTHERAWHAGVSSWRGREGCNDWSIGIELEGLEGRSFVAAQYRALQRLLRALARHHPIREVVGHEHVAPGRKHDPGARFEWSRLQRALGGCGLSIWPRLDPSP
ncbi:MAG TPA: 1,6-anhydro-N-acetylmuramyl-L-alanine amidase AmpD [Rubrivivax sp.]|nr:1,6-anhydro-N-acetylmuramyl-L-alanine amidase AmpD [Burkholderiales bacterium]HNU10478.1 1,6-anhydro-N-acetylmuramyl-L-alanine amidase AmpD [Rubrivivax sp.]